MDKGAHYYRCDFQVHTPRDRQWTGRVYVTDEERNEYASRFIEACREKSLDAVAITDHHDLTFAKYIREAAKTEVDNDGSPVPEDRQIRVFPGIELTLNVPCQALLIFDADFPDDLFSLALTALAITPSSETEEKTAETQRLDQITTLVELREELDKHEYLRGRYIILPNVSDGGRDTLIRAGNAPKYKAMPCVGGYVDGSIDKLGNGNTNIINGRAREYGNKRIAIFQTSDSRRDDHAELGSAATWVKWATPTAEALRQGCLAQESRVTQTAPVLPNTVVTSVSVSNSAFLGPVDIELNPQYTSFIGGRGTGKSTILEYLRWALCDQPPSPSNSDELPNYQMRRKHLIEQTLRKLKSTVQVGFLVNGIPHLVRRNSETQEILLKIGDGEFTPCKESEVRSLLPIQAYSQKQLSNVGVRVDELTRFIHGPIRNKLADIDKAIEEGATEVRQLHAALRRKRAIETGISNDELSINSLAKQGERIRESLAGISDEDRKCIAQQPLYEEAKLAINSWDTDIERVGEVLSILDEVLHELPTTPTRETSQLPTPEVLNGVQGEVGKLVTSMRGLSQQMRQTLETILDDNGNWSGDYKALREKWDTEYDKYQSDYKGAKEKSSALESRLTELTDIEKRVSELQAKVASSRKEAAKIGAPEDRYIELRQEWQRLHHERADLMEGECNNLTELSGEEIRATLRRGAGVDDIISKLKGAVTGSGLRREKIEAIASNVTNADDAISQWDEVLHELEILARFESQETDEESLPATPILSRVGLTNKDLLKVATKLSNEAWLDLALTRLEDNPLFEYRAREGEYISFVNASAGQQATSLLKALLNQVGPPLIIDQPEDDLDNPVIFEIVEQIWEAKKRRQLIFASHNANLVVNGDAELVAWCDYRASGDQSGGKIKGEGAIDIEETRNAIKQVMEGGEQAFKLRRDKYGF